MGTGPLLTALAGVHGGPLLDVAHDLALIAGVRMLHWRAQIDDHGWSPDQIASKGDPNNLVTRADAEIEALVRGHLAAVRPGDVLVGEEGAGAVALDSVMEPEAVAALRSRFRAAGSTSAAGPEYEWHVDPIDGTVNFVRGLEHHSFSVGVRTRGGVDPEDPEGRPHEPWQPQGWVLGLVAAPALGTVWFATTGNGAYRTSGGAGAASPATDPVRLHGAPQARPGVVVGTGLNYSRDIRRIQLPELERVLPGFDDIRRMGSAAIELCLAAEGRLNAYYERGLGVYDYAGGAVVAAEAGLAVRRGHEYADVTIAADTPERYAFLAGALGVE